MSRKLAKEKIAEFLKYLDPDEEAVIRYLPDPDDCYEIEAPGAVWGSYLKTNPV